MADFVSYGHHIVGSLGGIALKLTALGSWPWWATCAHVLVLTAAAAAAGLHLVGNEACQSLVLLVVELHTWGSIILHRRERLWDSSL